jgi:hypothetical protein
MKLLLLFVLLLQVAPLYATERLPLSHRTALAQRPMNEASSTSANHAWKLGLIGLAALGFLIRKRL